MNKLTYSTIYSTIYELLLSHNTSRHFGSSRSTIGAFRYLKHRSLFLSNPSLATKEERTHRHSTLSFLPDLLNG